ncbi:MAG: TetR/AcrR family transcriptional regulator [Candidatus Brocadiia bacterium]
MTAEKKLPRKGLLERRDRILQAALEIFTEKGFDRTTIDDIADRAGVGKGTVYNRVGRKEDFLELLIQRSAKSTLSNLKSAISKRNDPILQFKEMINVLCDMFEKDIKYFMLLWTQISIQANQRRLDIKESLIIQKDIARLFQIFEDIFNRAIKKKQLRAVDVPVIARTLLQLFDPNYYYYLRSKCNYTKSEIAQLTIGLFLNGLKPGK